MAFSEWAVCLTTNHESRVRILETPWKVFLIRSITVSGMNVVMSSKYLLVTVVTILLRKVIYRFQGA